MTDDELVDVLAPLDRTLVEAPPSAGSDRYNSILTRACPNRGRWRRAAGIAAASIAVIGGFRFLQSNHDHTAQAAIIEAAEGMAEVDSYEGWTSQIDPPQREIVRMQVSGDDAEVVGENPLPDGSFQVDVFTFVDGVLYETIGDGETTSTPRPDLHIPDYAEASSAVLLAIIDDVTISDHGPEEINGVTNERYTLTLDAASRAALEALPLEITALFGLDLSLDSATTTLEITVWIADDLIHRIDVTHDYHEPGLPGHPETSRFTQRTEYFNFNGTITITPPPVPEIDTPRD
jgi:hypothetical protein